MAQQQKNSSKIDKTLLDGLSLLEERVRWVSTWMIHNANHIRPSRDGLKVGGHQASCASISTIMTALYFNQLTKNDKVAVKPHASPIFHAIQYILGNQSLEQIQNFRSFGGAQSYPSRTKDKVDVDFSTGSVGLGVAITAFSSLIQDYLVSKSWMEPDQMGRMISLLGDAELDEGNIYEAMLETYKHDIRNTWWIVDYNRQSLDSITKDKMFDRFGDIFSTAGWEIVTLKYGKNLQKAFQKRGGEVLKEWIENCPNEKYSLLTYQGGKEWRKTIIDDLNGDNRIKELLDEYEDNELAHLMSSLGGHCLETLIETFSSIEDDKPRLFIIYTTKGFGLPLAGHKDNHAGLLSPNQIEQLRKKLNVIEGEEWEPLSGINQEQTLTLNELVASAKKRLSGPPKKKTSRKIPIPDTSEFPVPSGKRQSTQAAFGKIMNDLGRGKSELADRIVTTSPDVTVSTNLGGFVNNRGLYNRQDREDLFRKNKVSSPQRWDAHNSGQHIELGIAESNLFLMLGAMGISGSMFGEKLLPVGTLYDPFISRGLDSLNYASYLDARYLLVGTPSGLTLGPEGGAHQSIITPLIGIGQPGLTYFEPCFADELSAMMKWSFEHMQEENGGSVYIRLSTRELKQIERTNDSWRDDMLKGAYWLKEPKFESSFILCVTGALVNEVLEAYDELKEDEPGLGILVVSSPDNLHRGWTEKLRSRWTGSDPTTSHVESMLAKVNKAANIVTIIDGAPLTLSWLGSVFGQRVFPIGTEEFGQVGDLVDLFKHYRLDKNAIIDACAELLVS